MSMTNTEFRYDRVIFDVGGTLTGFHQQAPFQEFLAHAGLPALDEDARRFHHRMIASIYAERDHAQGKGADGAELDGRTAEGVSTDDVGDGGVRAVEIGSVMFGAGGKLYTIEADGTLFEITVK